MTEPSDPKGKDGRGAAVALLASMSAEDIEAVMAFRRYTPTTTHLCGCLTRFDTLDWRSEAVSRCALHAVQEAVHSGREDAS